MDPSDTVVNVRRANVFGIVHREEDSELRRHREVVLEKSRAWRVIVVLCAVAVGAAFVAALIELFFA